MAAKSQLSNLPSLTKEIAIDRIRNFFRDKPLVIFGTGLSCALDSRFGMPALKDKLLQTVQPDSDASEQQEQWTQVVEALESGCDLETALGHVQNHLLVHEIIRATSRFIACIDRKYGLQIACGETIWPATAFFKCLVDTLPEGDPILHVLTPNYDTLFEHACDVSNIHYTNGFVGGLKRRNDWQAAAQSLLRKQKQLQGKRLKTTFKPRRHIRIYKIHGSLNFFSYRNEIIENNSWMWNVPKEFNRVMIVPGHSKYQILQQYRQELQVPADREIDKSDCFLFLGYGFNDTHLETYIKRKLTTQSCKGLIVTRDCNARIKALLDKAENLWLVCKAEKNRGTRIFNKKYAGWLNLPTKELWDICIFTKEILGVQ